MALKNGQPEILVDEDGQSQAGGRNSLANSATYTKYGACEKPAAVPTDPLLQCLGMALLVH
jgi:hypothetical protein